MAHLFQPVRPAAVAGRFYPESPEALRRDVQRYLTDRVGSSAAELGSPPKAVIAPHAGYIYSGPVAGSAFAAWLGRDSGVRRVVLIGPAHYAEFPGLGLSGAQAFATPLGDVPVDLGTWEELTKRRSVRVVDHAHRLEHSLEVELPFLQAVLGEFSLIPILVGTVEPEAIAEVLDAVWGGPETRIVVSSDLSHYLDYPSARTQDAETARLIEALEVERLTTGHACGCLPIQALLLVARRRGLKPKAVDLRNSGDTAGTRDRVVGYGAFVFREG